MTILEIIFTIFAGLSILDIIITGISAFTNYKYSSDVAAITMILAVAFGLIAMLIAFISIFI